MQAKDYTSKKPNQSTETKPRILPRPTLGEAEHTWLLSLVLKGLEGHVAQKTT